jgi:hypothetical protein
MDTTKISLFKGKQIRKTLHNGEWWFSVVDVIEALTGSDRPRKYWSDLKKKLNDEGYTEVSDKIGQLKLKASDGKIRETDSIDTEALFRLVQSIPSPKAEPFKRWLAKVGYERVQEIENPECVKYFLSISIHLTSSFLPHYLSFPPPICHSRESGNPVEGKLQWESRMVYA